MLSFMREQGSGNSSESSAGNTGPRGVGSPDGGPQEFLTVATTRKSLRRNTILVVVLVAVGLVCLWMMIRKIQPQVASAQQGQVEQARIEQAISRLTDQRVEMVARTDAIVKKFYEFSDVFQVKTDELSKNPFEVETLAKKTPVPTVVTDNPELLRHQQLQRQISTLKLLCITQPGQSGSAQFYCVINDLQLREGDRIEDFTVSRITNNAVDLIWSGNDASGSNGSETEDIKITLKLSQ
jgi:hypothetical protein